MSNPTGSTLYSQGFGTTSSNMMPGNAVIKTVPPTSSDVRGPSGPYPLGQFWLDTVTEASYQLASFSATNGVVTANWISLGGGTTALDKLEGNTGTAFPVGGGITIAGTDGVETSASGSTVTISLTGGGTSIDSVTVQDFTGPGTNPVVPDGTGNINVDAAVVAAGTVPVQTNSTAANTYTVEVQTSQAVAATDATKIGLCNFNSSDFSVDANGFVSSLGGTFARSVGVDANTGPGTDPVLPTAGGLITVTGGQLPANSTANAIQTNSLASNTYTIQIQKSTTNAAPSAALNGIAHFDSTAFNVDADGFVTLPGGGIAIEQITTQTGSSPTGPDGNGNVTINGAVVAAGSVPIQTDSASAGVMAIEVQTSQAIAGTDATKIGLAAFNSTDFTVDANGFVSAIASTNITSGTFLPALTFGGGNTGLSYASRSGNYIVIGAAGSGNALVNLTGTISLMAKGSSTGSVLIDTGLAQVPFPSTTYGACSLSINMSAGVGYAGAVCRANSSSSQLEFFVQPAGATSTGSEFMTDVNFADDSVIQFSISYQS